MAYKVWVADDKKRYELLAEATRDIGVLVLVFVPLDSLIRDSPITSTRLLVAFGFLIFGFFLLAIGVRIGSE